MRQAHRLGRSVSVKTQELLKPEPAPAFSVLQQVPELLEPGWAPASLEAALAAQAVPLKTGAWYPVPGHHAARAGSGCDQQAGFVHAAYGGCGQDVFYVETFSGSTRKPHGQRRLLQL